MKIIVFIDLLIFKQLLDVYYLPDKTFVALILYYFTFLQVIFIH